MTTFRYVALLAWGVACGACASSPVAPVPDATPASVAGLQVPGVRDVRVRHTAELLVVDVLFERFGDARWTPFTPAHVGGWCFQLFFNTDQQPSGYGPGLDYLVRAVEVLPGGHVHVRRTTGGSGPGGWGESVGWAVLSTERGGLSLSLPLAILDDDGALDFVLELYGVVELPDGQLVHEFAAGYAGGSSDVFGRPRPLELRLTPLAPGAEKGPSS